MRAQASAEDAAWPHGSDRDGAAGSGGAHDSVGEHRAVEQRHVAGGVDAPALCTDHGVGGAMPHLDVIAVHAAGGIDAAAIGVVVDAIRTLFDGHAAQRQRPRSAVAENGTAVVAADRESIDPRSADRQVVLRYGDRPARQHDAMACERAQVDGVAACSGRDGGAQAASSAVRARRDRARRGVDRGGHRQQRGEGCRTHGGSKATVRKCHVGAPVRGTPSITPRPSPGCARYVHSACRSSADGRAISAGRNFASRHGRSSRRAVLAGILFRFNAVHAVRVR